MIVGYDTFIIFFCVFLRLDSEIERKQLFCYVMKCGAVNHCYRSLLHKSGVMASVVPAGGWQTSGGHGAVQWYSGEMSHQRGGCGQAGTQLG